jgi:hypothetical protein
MKGRDKVKRYYVTNGNQYISTKGGIHAVPDIKHATQCNITKASNLLTMMPKTLSKIADWTILPVPEEEDIKLEEADQKLSTMEFIDIDTMINELNELTSKTEYFAKYSKSINKQLAEVELEIEDLYHYIEFSTFNASQGYHAYKMLKERLIKRRQLKDERIILDSIQEKNMLTCTSENINETVEKLESRSYRPRVLKELFNV